MLMADGYIDVLQHVMVCTAIGTTREQTRAVTPGVYLQKHIRRSNFHMRQRRQSSTWALAGSGFCGGFCFCAWWRCWPRLGRAAGALSTQLDRHLFRRPRRVLRAAPRAAERFAERERLETVDEDDWDMHPPMTHEDIDDPALPKESQFFRL